MSQYSDSSARLDNQSPSHSFHRQDESIPIDTLVAWLVAAKRSLSSIHHVHRATTILSEARSAVESTTAVAAQSKYLRRSLGSQLTILRGIQYELEASTLSVKADIQTALNRLRKADSRLADNIQLLQQTQVESGFNANGLGQSTDQEGGVNPKKSLHDYVDDKPVEEVRQAANSTVSDVETAQFTMNHSVQRLEDILQSVNETLSDRTATSSSTRSDLQQPHIPTLLRALETHAREMAESLESLVKHFDLCVTAIKHTEGGGAAVARTIDTEDLPEGVGVDAFEAPVQPISQEERDEMLAVLENDAAEVDDVVMELQERGAEMESQLDHVFSWRDRSLATHSDVATAFKILEQVGDNLPSYIAESSRFAVRWSQEKAKIEESIAVMEELREVYDNFLVAYDGMIVEAARRRAVRKRMDKIVTEAQSQLDQLYEDDLNERDVFRSERGGFLPGDIWQGLDSLPARFAFNRLDEREGESVPELPKEVVASALKRLKAAHGWHEKDH